MLAFGRLAGPFFNEPLDNAPAAWYDDSSYPDAEVPMTTVKVAVTLDQELLAQIDQLVAQHVFPNRSKAIQAAIADKVARLRQSRLARACADLDPAAEQALAEEGMDQELATWPEY